MVQTFLIPTAEVPNVWADASESLRPAIKRIEERITEADVYEELILGKQDLWVSIDEDNKPIVWATTKVYPEFGHNILVIYSVGGEGFREVMGECLETLCNYGRDMNCSFIEFYGRPGWKVLEPYGFEKKAIHYQKKL